MGWKRLTPLQPREVLLLPFQAHGLIHVHMARNDETIFYKTFPGVPFWMVTRTIVFGIRQLFTTVNRNATHKFKWRLALAHVDNGSASGNREMRVYLHS